VTLVLSTAVRNAKAKAAVDQLDAGSGPATIQIRSGVRPATPATAAAGTLLATIVLADPAGGAPANGVVTIADPGAVTAVAAGEATWARFLDSSGNAVWDCDVSGSAGTGDLRLATTTISAGLTVDFGAINYTQPA